jgi:hypothetical protein
MKKLSLACLILSFSAAFSAAGPAPQSNPQTLGKSKCSSGFKECQESLNDFKEAERFMQLKASVHADLSGLEKSRATRSKIAPVRDAGVHRMKTGNAVVYSAIMGTNGSSAVPATSMVQPVSLKSIVAAPRYKQMP